MAEVTELHPRYHASWSEPHELLGTWTSPPTCLPSAPEAREFVESTTRLAGPAAAARREWTIRPCHGGCGR